jgi:ADP-ribosylation factor protein 1
MGNVTASLQHLLYRWSTKKDVNIILIGLDCAGKTTLLYKMKIDDVITTIPTLGNNVETIRHNRINFTVWDLGGQILARPQWGQYHKGSDAVIFVVDSCDSSRMDEARAELHKVMAQRPDAKLLILANKQDLPGSMHEKLIIDALQPHLLKYNTWKVQTCSAYTGQGLMEGFDWLSAVL